MEQNKKSSGITTSRNFACSQSSYFSLQHAHMHTHTRACTRFTYSDTYIYHTIATHFMHTHTQKGVHTLRRFRHTCMPYHIHTLYAHNTHTYTHKRMCTYSTDPHIYYIPYHTHPLHAHTHTTPKGVYMPHISYTHISHSISTCFMHTCTNTHYTHTHSHFTQYTLGVPPLCYQSS